MNNTKVFSSGEECLPHPIHAGYKLGKDGTCWSCWDSPPSRSTDCEWWQLKGHLSFHGYRSCCLRKLEGGFVFAWMHRLVLETFVGPCPDGKEGCHNDGNKDNNQLSNIRWDSRFGNVQDALKHGVFPRGENSGNAVLSEEQARSIVAEYARGDVSQSMLGVKYGVSHSCINMIVRGKRWAALGCKLMRSVEDEQRYKARLEKPRVGEKSSNVKLKEVDILAIRVRYAAGKVSQSTLAKEFGVDQAHISAIVLRKVWSHLP